MTTLFTCRHTFEQTLLAELNLPGKVLAPGLVQLPLETLENPAYALQILPDAQEIHAESIKALAQPLVQKIQEMLDAQPGMWDLHALVLGQLKGNPRPMLRRRADLILAAVLGLLPRWALKRRQAQGRQLAILAQFVLMDETHAWQSVALVQPLLLGATWPATLPAGLADVADDDVAPASSYRKLVEAFACLDRAPLHTDTCVDLGACPGGWTHVLLRTCGQVMAIDRAPLAPHLLADKRVNFVRGDAFAWLPDQPVAWLVSDIIAFPERVAELLETWLQPHLCQHFVVQMKFKGEPDWPALERAKMTAEAHQYKLLVRHFFNDKNELTLMGTLQTEE